MRAAALVSEGMHKKKNRRHSRKTQTEGQRVRAAALVYEGMHNILVQGQHSRA